MDVDHVVGSAPPPTARRTRRFVAGGAIIATSLVGGLAMLITSYTGTSDRVEDLTRIDVGDTGTVVIDEPGRSTIYHEYPGASADEIDRPPPDLTITDPTGQTVPLVAPDDAVGYTMAGHEGEAIHAFDADEPGTYQVTVRGEPAGAIAIGPNIGHDQLRAILVPILLMIAGVVIGLVVTARRPRRATPTATPEGPRD